MFVKSAIRTVIFLIFTPIIVVVDNKTVHSDNSIDYDSNSFDSGPLLAQPSHSMPIEFHHYLHSIHNKENKVREIEAMKNTTKATASKESSSIESWCVVWYLGAFGSLVCFFFIITCTELFFGNPSYRDDLVQNEKTHPQTPPPPYHLFAPPDYNASIGENLDDGRMSRNIFIVPVHLHTHASCCNSNYLQPAPPKYDEGTGKMLERGPLPAVVAITK